MELPIAGELWHWRGPAPYHFVTVPDDACDELRAVAASLTYGWGMIPVAVQLGATSWTTSLFPKDGGYVLPIKDAVRRAESLELGDVIQATLHLGVRGSAGDAPDPGRAPLDRGPRALSGEGRPSD
jgi:hypothetical protein